jgi:hypothetical protein
MICWDWIGFVIVRRVTFCIRSTSGIMNRNPGSRTLRIRPKRKTTPRWYSRTIATPRLAMNDSPNPGFSDVRHQAFYVGTPLTTAGSPGLGTFPQEVPPPQRFGVVLVRRACVEDHGVLDVEGGIVGDAVQHGRTRGL